MRINKFIILATMFGYVNAYAETPAVGSATIKMPANDSSPASFVLGASPNNIVTANTLSDLVAGVGKGLKNGEDQSAVSIQFNPVLLSKYYKNWDDIVKNKFSLMLAQTSISFANTLDNKKGSGLESAIGIQSVYSKKMEKIQQSLALCLDDYNKKARESKPGEIQLPPPGRSQEYNRVEAEALRSHFNDNCKAKIESIENKWNLTTVAVGYAHGFKAKKDDVGGNETSDLNSYWLTGQYGDDFKNPFRGFKKDKNPKDVTNPIEYLLTAHVRQSDDIYVIDGNSASITDQTLYGINLKLGNERFRGLMEFSYMENKGKASKKAYLAGVEFPLLEKNFVTLGVVGDTENEDQGVVAKFSWQLNDKYTLPVNLTSNEP